MMAFTMFDEFLRQNDPTLYLNDLQAIRQQRAMDLEYTLGVMQPAIDYETRNHTFRQRLDEIELQDRLGQERQQREQRYALERAMMGAGFFDVAAPYGISPRSNRPRAWTPPCVDGPPSGCSTCPQRCPVRRRCSRRLH